MIESIFEKQIGFKGWKSLGDSLDELSLRRTWAVTRTHLTPPAVQVGGCKSASASVVGPSVYGRLKFEAGIHRVQRVPATEKSGRVHTSAASVAVLPQADEVPLPTKERPRAH